MVNNLIATSIKRSVSYSTYRTLIKSLLVEGKSTGNEQSEVLLDFSKLNDKRMDKLDKTLKFPKETRIYLQELDQNFTLLVLAEGWCGDAAQILPMVNHMSENSSKIDFKNYCFR